MNIVYVTGKVQNMISVHIFQVMCTLPEPIR